MKNPSFFSAIAILACLTLADGTVVAQTAGSPKGPLTAAKPGIIGYGSNQQTTTNGLSQGYLASIIPTPGLTPSSTCGTTGVRCAADAHFAASGQGEGLNQSSPGKTPEPQFNNVSPSADSAPRAADTTCESRIRAKSRARHNGGAAPSTGSGGDAASSTSQYLIQDDYANLLPLPFQPLFSPAAQAGYNPSCTPGVFFYQVGHDSDTVFKIATCPLAVLKSIPVCSNPLQVQSTPDGTTEVVTCYDNAIAFIDTATDKVTTIQTPLYYPNGIDISPDGSTAYIASYIDNPSVIFSVNLATRQLNPQTVTVSAYPKNIFLTPDGAQLWVIFYQATSLYVLDTLSMTVAGTISLPGSAQDGMAFSPDGTRAYVAIAGGSVSVIDTATLTQVASIPIGDQPSGVVVSKDGSRVYVDSISSNNPMFSVIDVATNKVIATYPQIGPALGFIIFN